MVRDIEGGELANNDGDGSDEWRPGRDFINKDGETKTPSVFTQSTSKSSRTMPQSISSFRDLEAGKSASTEAKSFIVPQERRVRQHRRGNFSADCSVYSASSSTPMNKRNTTYSVRCRNRKHRALSLNIVASVSTKSN